MYQLYQGFNKLTRRGFLSSANEIEIQRRTEGLSEREKTGGEHFSRAGHFREKQPSHEGFPVSLVPQPLMAVGFKLVLSWPFAGSDSICIIHLVRGKSHLLCFSLWRSINQSVPEWFLPAVKMHLLVFVLFLASTSLGGSRVVLPGAKEAGWALMIEDENKWKPI